MERVTLIVILLALVANLCSGWYFWYHPRAAAVFVVLWPFAFLLTFGATLLLVPTLIVAIGVVAWHLMNRLLRPTPTFHATLETLESPQPPPRGVDSHFHILR